MWTADSELEESVKTTQALEEISGTLKEISETLKDILVELRKQK